MKRWIITILVIVALAVAGYFYFQQARQRANQETLASLQIVKAVQGDLVATVGGTGVVRTNQTGMISWQASGIVEMVNGVVGDEVDMDQNLASLKPTSLAQNVILAQADLANAQKALEELYDTGLSLVQADQAIVRAEDALKKAQDKVNGLGKAASQSDIDVAEATVLLAKIKLDRAWDDYKPFQNKPEDNPIRAALFNKYAQAKQDYDLAVSRINNLRGNPSDLSYRLAQADLDVAQANLDDSRSKYEDLSAGPDARDVAAIQARITAAQATLNTASITAPFAGTITEVHIKPGDQVSPGTAAFRLDDFSSLLIDVPISEVDITRVEPGQEVTLSFDAISARPYQGVVTEVAQVGVVSQGVVDFNVTIALTDADGAVRPGMTAAVNIIVEHLRDVLLVPNRAVRVEDGERVVYILKNGLPESIQITLGASSEVDSQVIEGDLQAGDSIVLNPPVEFNFTQEPSFVRSLRGGN